MTVPVLVTALAVAGVLLTMPASVLLARARWPRRAPRPALWLWQAVCLSAGLSLVSAGIVVAISPLGDDGPAALRAGARQLLDGEPFRGLGGWQVAAGLASGVLAAVLLSVLLHSAVLAVRRRRAHRLLLDLLTTPAPVGTGGTAGAPGAPVRVLDHRAAVAYTLAGWHSRVVLTAGLVDLLTPAELGAVIEHERAHLRSRHDLLILPFQAWATALGFLPGVRECRYAVGELAEMLADDIAARRSRPTALASALARVALAGNPPGTSEAVTDAAAPAAIGRTAVTTRVRRLLDPQPLPVVAVVAVYLTALLLVAVPPAVLVIGWG